jgi:hypothetical protein
MDVWIRIGTGGTDTVGRRDGGSVEGKQTGGAMGTIAWGEVPGTLRRVPVRVRLTRTGSKPAIWLGRAEADAELVAVGFARYRSHLHWCKTTRRGSWSDDLPGLHTGLWISELKHATLPGPVTVQLQLPGVAPAWSAMAEPGTPVEIHEAADFRTGDAIRLVRIEGSDPLEVGVLFLARADVRGARKGAWHIRKAALDGIPETWAHILTGPRTGQL